MGAVWPFAQTAPVGPGTPIGGAEPDAIDVRDFTGVNGPYADGVDSTAAVVAGILACANNSVVGVPRPSRLILPGLPDPKGGVLLSAGQQSAIINIPTNVSIKGSGWRTHLTVNPLSTTQNNASYHLFDMIGGAGRNIIEDLQIDGNKSNIAALTNTGMNLLYVSDSGVGPAVLDVILRYLFIHDGFASAGVEGFGILAGGHTGFLGVRGIIDHVWAYNINGSGISVAGPGGLGTTTVDYIVSECECFGNSYNGTTYFQTQNLIEVGTNCMNNGRSGTNIEFANNVQIIGGRKRVNGFAGITVQGLCQQVSLIGPECVGNWAGTGFGEEGEISINQDTIAGVTAMPYSVYIQNPTLLPNQGPPLISQIAVSERGINGSAGQASACSADDSTVPPFKGIFITAPDAEKWNYTVPSAPFNQKYAPNGLIIRTGASGGPAPNQGGHPSTWTLTNLTVSAASAGAIGANAKKFTQTAANVASSAITVAAMLLSGHRYRIRYRLKPFDANATWEFGAVAGQKVIRVPSFANDFGVYFEGEFIITIPVAAAATSLQLATVAVTVAASVIDVDYVTSELLPFVGGISGS